MALTTMKNYFVFQLFYNYTPITYSPPWRFTRTPSTSCPSRFEPWKIHSPYRYLIPSLRRGLFDTILWFFSFRGDEAVSGVTVIYAVVRVIILIGLSAWCHLRAAGDKCDRRCVSWQKTTQMYTMSPCCFNVETFTEAIN